MFRARRIFGVASTSVCLREIGHRLRLHPAIDQLARRGQRREANAMTARRQIEPRHQRQLAGRAADHLRRHGLLAGLVDRLNLEARRLVGGRRRDSAPT